MLIIQLYHLEVRLSFPPFEERLVYNLVHLQIFALFGVRQQTLNKESSRQNVVRVRSIGDQDFNKCIHTSALFKKRSGILQYIDI